MINAEFEVREITTGYSRTPILHGVSLGVDSGEIVGLLGGNGAGKSTVLRAISGNLRCWSGSIWFEGQELTRLSPWARVRTGIAHVPSGRRVFGPLTVRENLDVARTVARGKPPAYDEVLALFPKLAERADQIAGSMSGGEQQMLAIGRALMTRPRLLLVDEMTAGLSPLVTEELLAGLRRINEELGVAMLIVEQSPFVVDVVGERLYLLEQGTIVASGTFESVGGANAIADLYLGVSQE